MDNKSRIVLKDYADKISLPDTLDCGQAFRWRPVADRAGWWTGIAKNRVLVLGVVKNDLVLETTDEDYEKVWRGYFDIDRDYDEIKKILSKDSTLNSAVKSYPGLRLLRQEPWETVCSFIISANNNIPRIKGIIERLCEGWGDDLGGGSFGFPGPQKLASCSVEDLAPLRAGYRADYLVKTARMVTDGTVDLGAIESMDDNAAYKELLKLQGVGPKVADCILLYGYGRFGRIPVDVWIKRVLAKYYPDGLPEYVRPYIGAAQQFLFHYERHLSE